MSTCKQFNYYWDQYKGHSTSAGYIMRKREAEYRGNYSQSPILQNFIKVQDYTLDIPINGLNQKNSEKKPCCKSCVNSGVCSG